jgi:CBS domain-containing protein
MNGIICDPSKSQGLETELTLSPAITVHYTSKIVDVAKVMSVKDNTTCVLVIDDRGQLCGILTDKDIVFRVLATGMDPKRTAVHTVMTANPITATLETAKKVAMQAIYTGAFWHIPIINDSDSSSVVKTNIIGMINLNELFGRDIVEKLQQTPSFLEFSSVPSSSDVSFANRSMYSDIDMISRYEEIRQQKLTVVLDQHEESPPEIDGKMNVSIASNIMKIYKKGAVIVCDTDTRSLLGILTTQDLILRVVAAGRYPASTSAKSVMTPNPPVVNPNKQVSKTLQYMLDNNYKYIVIGADLKITGIVDILEVTRAALQQLQDRDEIEEDARSRRSFSEDGSSYYESSSRLMHRSSRSTLQSFDENDKARNVPHIRVDLLKEESNLTGNILDNISDDEDKDRNDMNPSAILPRDISLMNNIITETIPELDEDKESEVIENDRILDKLSSPSNELYESVENNVTEPTIESSEHQTIENEFQQINEEDIPVNLPVIQIKLDPDMDAQQQNEIIEDDNVFNNTEQITEPNENELNNEEIVEPHEIEATVGPQHEIESNIQQIIEPNEIENHVNEIVLPNDIENDINEIIENSEIDTSLNEIMESNVNDHEIVIPEENNVIINQNVEPTKIENMNEIIEPNEIETNMNLNNMIAPNENDIEVIQRDIVLDDVNDIKPEDLIEINKNVIENENIENEINHDLELQDININDDEQLKDVTVSVPEFVISNEESSVPITKEQDIQLTNNGLEQINEAEFNNIHPFNDIPRELAMIEESINQYNMDHLTPPSALNNTHGGKKDVATFDALLEIEVNDEGIHNGDGNNTFYDMDDFIVSNNNDVINGTEQDVSDEAKRFVDNILGSESNIIPDFSNEVTTEVVNDNATEADNFDDLLYNNEENNNSLDMIKEEEPITATPINNEPEFIGSVSNPEITIDDKPSLEFSNIKVQYVDPSEVDYNKIQLSNNNENNNEIYDLSTIMPSSPPMPINNNYQDKIIPPLDLNESMEKNETNSLQSHEIRGSLRDHDSLSMNHHEIASIQSNDFVRNSDYIRISNNDIEEDLSSTLQPTAGHDENNKEKDDDNKSAIMETIALDSESNIVLDQNQENGPVIERGNLIEFQKDDEQLKKQATPKTVLEYIRQIVTPNVISHIFKYSLDKSQLDDAYPMDDNSTTMLVKRVVGGRDLYDEENRRYNDRDDSSSTVLYPSQYMNTSQKRVSLSRLAATQSIIKEEDLLLKCFDQETEQIYRINYNNSTKYEDIVNAIIKKSEIEDRDTLLFGYLDEDRDFIKIENEEDFLQGIWLARKLLWGRLFIVIKRKNKSTLMNLLPWSGRSAANNANNDQGNWLSNAMLIGVGIAATLAVKKISS